jgi:hypothetical protein
MWPFVPWAAMLGALVAWFVVLGTSLLIGGNSVLVLAPLSAGAATYAWVRCGVLWAPRYKRAVALMLATFPLALVAILILPNHASPAAGPGAAAGANVFEALANIISFKIPDRFATIYHHSYISLAGLGGVLGIVKSWNDAEPCGAKRELSAKATTIRWGVFVPTALVLALLTYSTLASTTPDPDYTLFITIVTGAVLVMSATALAPTHKLLVGVACVTALASASAIVAILRHAHGEPFTPAQWALAAMPIGGALLGLFAALSATASPIMPAQPQDHTPASPPPRSRARTGLQWTFVAFAFLLAVMIAFRVSSTWRSQRVFAPPVGWTSWPSIPFVTPRTRAGYWTHDQQSIYLSKWTPRKPVLTPKSFDQSTNLAYTHFQLGSARMIQICGDHPALMQTFTAVWNGEPDAIAEVYTIWGDTGYWAQYVRPASLPPDDAAMQALQTLCGQSGAPLQYP